MVSRNEGCKEHSLKVIFCDFNWIVKYFGIVLFLNLENLLFWNVNEGWFKENVCIIERWVEADSSVCNVEFSSDDNISWVSTVELIKEVLVFCNRKAFLFGEPFLSFVGEYVFEFWFHGPGLQILYWGLWR